MQTSYENVVSNLFAATQIQPVVAGAGIISAGEGDLVRGTLLTTTDGVKYTVVKEGEDVLAVLAVDVNAESDTEAALYFTGEFNKKALVAAEGVEIDTLLLSARKVGIFIKENQ